MSLIMELSSSAKLANLGTLDDSDQQRDFYVFFSAAGLSARATEKE